MKQEYEIGERVWVSHFKEGGTVMEIYEGIHYDGSPQLIYRTKMDKSEGDETYQKGCLDWFGEYLEKMSPLRDVL